MSKALLAIMLAGPLLACSDPVAERVRAELGPEEIGVEPGPLHRPGQPCVACHDGSESSEVFSLAGTLYESSDPTKGAKDIEVRIIDYVGRQTRARTNEVGNFYVKKSDFEPNWPVWIKVVRGKESLEMTSPIYREGSCSACHQGNGDPSHAEAIRFPGGG